MTNGSFVEIHVRLDKTQEQELRAFVIEKVESSLESVFDELNAEIDRLHDECNQRAKEQEIAEEMLLKATGLTFAIGVGNSSTSDIATFAVERIAYLERELRSAASALVDNYRQGVGVGMIVGSCFVAACGILAWLVL